MSKVDKKEIVKDEGTDGGTQRVESTVDEENDGLENKAEQSPIKGGVKPNKTSPVNKGKEKQSITSSLLNASEIAEVVKLAIELRDNALEAKMRISRTELMADGGEAATAISGLKSIFTDGTYSGELGKARGQLELLEAPTAHAMREGVLTMVRQFKFIDTLQPYITYATQNTALQSDSYHKVTAADDAIIGQTLIKFPIGLGLAMLQYNEDKIKTHGLKMTDNVPQSTTLLIDPSGILVESDVLRFKLGQLRILYGMYADNSVYTVANETITPPRDVTEQLQAMLGTKLQGDIGVNPALLSISTMYPEWLRDDLLVDLQGDIYKLGRMRDFHESRHSIKSMSVYGVNADHYTCALLNANAAYLRANRVSVEYQLNQLKACSLAGSTIETLPHSDLRLDAPRIQAVDERAMALSLIMDNTLPDRMLQLNIEALQAFDVIQASDKMVLFNQDQIIGGTTEANLRQTLARWAGAVNVGKVVELFAAEVTPIVSLMRLSPMLEVHAENDNGLVLLWLIKLNVEFRPNAFNAVKHLVQSYLFDFMGHWMSSEYLRFRAEYGAYYTIVNGRKNYVPGDYAFQPEDFISGRYPSLFAGIDFKDCPNITALMKLLQPNGVEQPDKQPTVGAFPRLNRSPTHYNPFTTGVHGNIRAQLAGYQAFVQLLLRLSASNSIRRPNSLLEQIRSWLTWTVGRMKLIYEGMNKISDALSVIQNLPHNVLRNFDGHFDTYKPLNLRAVGTSGSRDMIRYRSDGEDVLNLYHLTDVLSIFGQMETPSMQAQGETRIKAEISFNTTPPDPMLLLTPSMSLVDECQRFALAYGFISITLSDEGLVSFPELSSIRDRMPQITEGMFKSILSELAQTDGIDTKPMSQVNIALTNTYFNQKMDLGKIEIRRVVDGLVQDFDPVIDRPSLQDSNWFVDDIHLKRLRIGLKSIHNKRLPRIRKGLRFSQQHELQFNFDKIPSVTGRTHIVYSRAIEVIRYVQNSTQQGFLIDNVERFEVNTFPKDLHITVRRGRDVSTTHRSLLDLGVRMAGWIVDIEEAYFIPRLTININERNDLNLMTVLDSNDDKVHTLILYDTVSWLYRNQALMPRDYHVINSVYPMMKVSDGVSMRGIVMLGRDQRENWHVSPRRAEMDTGTLDDSGIMRYTDNGLDKLESTNEVSMTNLVLTYPNGVTLDGRFPYRYTPPSVWPYNQ